VKKLINSPDQFVDEMIDGILLAHPRELRSAGSGNRSLVRADAPVDGHVGIVTGGGSGHLPLFLGYVGHGLCSGVAVGNVFSSPSSKQILAATREVDSKAGVLYLFGNYGGDVLNFGMAAAMAKAVGIDTRTVLTNDDVASAPPDRRRDRRGVAGMFFAYKCAGALAERGAPLDDVAGVAEEINSRTRTMGVGLSPTILPAAGEPTFTLEEGEIELGIGIHGEPGVRRTAIQPADQIVDELLDRILADLPEDGSDDVAVLVNGLGATPQEELYVMYRRVHQRLSSLSLKVHRVYVGEFATSLEMAGASVSVARLTPKLTELLDAPASSPFFRQ
jgi:phosphoenolpyruvate---glycerone phosphotransferase subunit DhaK